MPKTIKELLKEHSRYVESKGRQGTRLTTVLLNSVQWDKSKDLYEANLQFASLRGADLTRANLQGADLGWATLGGAKLQGANLFMANLEGAELFSAYFFDARMTDEQKDYVLRRGAIINE